MPIETPAEATTPPPAIATTPLVDPIPAVWAPSPRDAQGRTAYGLYLQGRLLTAGSASHEGEGTLGARYLAEVVDLAPEQPKVREQAFTAAFWPAGWTTPPGWLRRARACPPSSARPVAWSALSRPSRTADARAAMAPLKANPIRPPHGRAAVLVQPWIAAAPGDWDLALTAPRWDRPTSSARCCAISAPSCSRSAAVTTTPSWNTAPCLADPRRPDALPHGLRQFPGTPGPAGRGGGRL